MINQAFVRTRLYQILLVLASVTTAALAHGAEQDRTQRGERTALDRYIAEPDTNYTWRLARTVDGPGYKTYVIDLISQSWRSSNEVNRTLWQHWLTIVKPDTLKSSIGMLYIDGGGNSTNPPSRSQERLILVATTTGTAVAELRNVPNQPLIFAGETKGRSEDSLIAYTWDKFLRTGDDHWPARLPMTKAAVRALDTITAFCASEAGGHATVDKFFVAGGSKRGWTTWTTAAVDRRVIAIAPIVIDLLNIVPSFVHHYEAYGFYAPAVGDYVREKIMDWNGTPEYRALMKIEEPFEYRERLDLPKFILNAAGDQFFLPDSSQFYFQQLPGVKYLRYVPNTDHSMKGSDAWMTLLACYSAVIKDAKLPQFTWSSTANGRIEVKTSDRPDAVKLWQATNPDARDFRLMTIKDAWTSTDLTEQGGVYIAKVEKPAKGWTAFFVELTYGTGATPFKFTTGVQVVPDIKPFKYKQPTAPR
jgi:PhoPQ-activated pathogenicity-related protein